MTDSNGFDEAVPPPLPTSTNEVRVLLDTGSSDDLIFTKKGSGGEDAAEDGVTTTTTTNNIIHAAERIFVRGAYTPAICLEILESVHSAIPTEVAKQLKRLLRK